VQEGGYRPPHEPEYVPTLRADVVRRFLVRPIDFEKRRHPRIQERIALMELLMTADSARQPSLSDLDFDGPVAALDRVEGHADLLGRM
jgi:hypothetical protein